MLCDLWGLFWLLQKNGGKIWIFKDRGKGFFGRGEKVHFWKIQFQNLFQKSKIRNFAAIFIYMAYMNDIGFVENGISKRRAKNIFLRLKGPRSITTNQYNYDLICSRICS